MGKIVLDKSMSLDGYITVPNPSPAQGMGEGGERIFAWFMENQDEPGFVRNNELLQEAFTSTGAVIMGKRSFEIIDSPNGWVAPDGTPFTWPVFILTHEVREPVTKGQTPFTFVNGGAEDALRQAREIAGGGNIGVMGANVAQQFIRAGLLDEIVIHLVPVLMGGGVRLFDHLDASPFRFAPIGVIESPTVTHLRYRVIR